LTQAVRLKHLLDDLPTPKRNLDVRQDASARDVFLARLYGKHYYDGSRSQGYGGYVDDGRWIPVASRIAQELNYNPSHSVCEIGCAKGYLLAALVSQKLISTAYGLDASLYALSHAVPHQNIHLLHANATYMPIFSQSIDHVLCINTLHNFLDTNDVIRALREISRVCKRTSYIRVAAYSNDIQRCKLETWATAGRGYFHVDEWLDLFQYSGYRGYYDWWHPDPSVKL